MGTILKLSKKHNIKIFGDCARALRTKYKGKRVGSIGNAGSRFYPIEKTWVLIGDGGMIITDHPQIAEVVNVTPEWCEKNSLSLFTKL